MATTRVQRLRRLYRCASALVTLLIVCGIALVGGYSAFALWDQNRAYTSVDDLSELLAQYKPQASPEGDGPGFEQLRAINPDVCAWITMDGTSIDYPVLQGESNLAYVSADVYGNFALAGSIFLDARNAPGFTDAYSLLYGHHMVKHKMFGDLDLYEDAAFFEANRTGVLVLPDCSYTLEVLACLKCPASADVVFDPVATRADLWPLLDLCAQPPQAEAQGGAPDAPEAAAQAEGEGGSDPGIVAEGEAASPPDGSQGAGGANGASLSGTGSPQCLHAHEGALAQVRDACAQGQDVQLVALSTCAGDYTNARTVVVARMREM